MYNRINPRSIFEKDMPNFATSTAVDIKILSVVFDILIYRQCSLRVHHTEFIPKQLFYSLTSHYDHSHVGIRPIFFSFHIPSSISLCSPNHASITGNTYLEKSPFISPFSRSILPCTSSSK